MAWSLVGISAVTTSASDNFTAAEPSGTQEGDLLIVVIATRFAASSTDWTPFSGEWTIVKTEYNEDVTANSTSSVGCGFMAYMVRGASAPSSMLFSSVGTNIYQGACIAYRGNAATSPLDVSSSLTAASASTQVTTGALTTTEADELIVAVRFGARSGTVSNFDATDPGTASGATDTTAAPTAGTWIERLDASTTSGADCSLGIADAIKSTAGSTGTISCDHSTSARHSMIAAAFKIAASSSPQGLEPPLLRNTNRFFAPAVTVGAVTLQPPLVRDDDRFFAPTVTQAQILSPPLLRERVRLFPPGPRPAQFFSEPSDFADASWTKTNVTISGTAGAPDGQLLTESTDGAPTSHRIQQSFDFELGVHTLEAEVKAVTSGRDDFRLLYNGATTKQAFFNARTGEKGSVSPGCYSAIQALEDGWFRATFVFTASSELVSARLDLVDGTSGSYTGDGRGALRVREMFLATQDRSLAIITQTAPAPTELFPPLLRDEDRFFAPTITTGAVGLTAPFLRDADRAYALTLSVGTVTLSPPLTRDQDRFFVPVVTRGAVTLTPALYRNPDRFFAPAITVGGVSLTPPLLRDDDRFFAPALALGDVFLLPPVLRDEDQFFAFTVANVGDPGALAAGSDVGGQTCTDLFVPERPAEIYRVVARTR